MYIKNQIFILGTCLLLVSNSCKKEKEILAIPLIYTSDLYHPHCDPDDHFDLASVYALVQQGEFDIKGVLIDYPRVDLAEDNIWGQGDPDVIGFTQLNMVTGMIIPSAIGSSVLMKSEDQILIGFSNIDRYGVDMVIKMLEQVEQPAVIHITGSSRDIAFAGNERPELFREKCKAIYINAGVAIGPNFKECNAGIDSVAYYSLFKLPCPIYWLPCVHSSKEDGSFLKVKGEYSSWWEFEQKNILPFLTEDLQRFFLYMFRDGHGQETKEPFNINWVRYMKEPLERFVIDEQYQQARLMWCTAGFLHSVGKTVTMEGDIVDLSDVGNQAVFSFNPIKINQIENSIIDWDITEKSDRYILKINDREKYEGAMEKALKELLLTID